MSQEKFETVRRHLVALNARDVNGYLACCTDDVVLVPVTVAIEGEYTGRSGIERFFADLSDTAPDMEVEAEQLETVGQNVLAFERGRVGGRASEIGADIDFTTVYEFRGRKISRIRVFLNRQSALAAVGLSEQDAHADS
jgi:hypothetical protein